ncbi:MAG TPA: sodium:solute symporter family protein [Chthoniobacterales bacterium]|jgi:SSS family solute:Na+ symporter|nr:sodium:solute symporter family protein [Chthoniobacterales bacterium]
MNTGGIHLVAGGVFAGFFILVSFLGLWAARWRAGDMRLLDEWALAGRRFGIFITWFLVGGDLYTAYTVIAVPALVYSVGAYGFFAIPYAVIIYPFVFAVMPRFWAACREAGHFTAADFVQARFANPALGFAVAVTGILATMPYIALQLVGMRVLLDALGLGNSELSLVIAFVILALYTYKSGIRAPAMIAFVKDCMLYITVLAAVVYIPLKLGGYGAVFDEVARTFALRGGPSSLLLKPGQMLPFASLALGSALALFMYPHSVTGVLSSSGVNAIRWNAILLPTYTVLLGLVALMGYMAIAAHVKVANANQVVPALLLSVFPDWFVGFSFAAIAIGALVPSAIMSIGAAKLFTRNLWKPLARHKVAPEEETLVAKLASLGLKLGALLFILFVPTEYAIDLQLLGGIWILQTFPAIVFGLYRTSLRGGPLFLGWLVGMIGGTWCFALTDFKPVIQIGGVGAVYIAVVALVLNLVVCFSGSILFQGARH